MRSIFITGVGGCVGHYVFDELAHDPNNLLFLLVRSPDKLKLNPAAFPNVTILQDDLQNISAHADLLKKMDIVIHLAADWGGNEGNYDYTLRFFNLLDPEKCRRVIYFSTASILGPDNQPSQEAGKSGTHYIRSKWRIYQEISRLRIGPNVTTLFPTWVLGGDAKHPCSHALAGILGLKKWLWLIKFISVDIRFHYIHAQDLARIAKHLLENDNAQKNFVLGNAPLSADEFIAQVCAYFKQRIYFKIPITPAFIRGLARLTGRKLHPWDEYCLRRRHFVYKTVNAESFGLVSRLKSIEEILQSAV
jgi:nucleoside-diphosphate-sugar epimerase